jgi:hypothetical protein
MQLDAQKAVLVAFNEVTGEDLGYFDYSFTVCVPDCLILGLQIDESGIYPYWGVGLGTVGGSLTANWGFGQDPSPGGNCAITVSGGVQVLYSIQVGAGGLDDGDALTAEELVQQAYGRRCWTWILGRAYRCVSKLFLRCRTLLMVDGLCAPMQ